MSKLDKIKNITKVLLLIVLAALVGYDVWVMATVGQDASISKTIIDWGLNYPMVPFAFGVLIGHFFWQLKKDHKD